MSPTLASWLPTLIAAPLIAFALYRRFKRSFGRQPVGPKRMIARMVLLALVCVLFLALAPTPSGFAAAAAGAAVGIGLAFLGLAHTEIESSAEGAFYTPNKWIGIGVMALFIGRLAARMFTVYRAAGATVPGATPFDGIGRSPLTTAILFVMAAYYIAYYAGVLRRARASSKTNP